MKKKSLVLVLGLVAPALQYPAAATAAETILTPTQLQSVPHVINNFSVWQGDSTIAFDVTVSSGPSNIWTVPRFGTTGTQITNGLLNAHDPAWAPFMPNTGTPPMPGQPPSQTNTLGLLAYIQDTANANELVVNGYGSQSSGIFVRSYSWSLDASSLVIDGFPNPVSNPLLGELYTTVLLGPGPVAIIPDCNSGVLGSGCLNPQWSPTENVIAYNNFGFFLVNPDGSGNHEIIPASPTINGVVEDIGGATAVWSPNSGSEIAFDCIGAAAGGSDICVATSDGVNPTNLTNGALGLNWGPPSWSIDENFIAMVGIPPSSPPGALGDIYVIPSVGGMPVALTSTGNVRVDGVKYSPLTDEIFYICMHGSNADLCVIPQSPAAGGTPQSCGASNCSTGCCLQDICLRGVVASACGTGGPACVACPGNQVCSSDSQTCIAAPVCDASNCDGCCDSSGACHPGTQASACGTGGAACVACSGNEVCSGAQHVCESNLCSATTCAGCCNAGGQCELGGTATSCGVNGFACVACPGNEQCNSSGICEAPQTCDISTCPTGCCNASGVCEAGDSSTSCGTAGAACVSCNGGVCDNNSRTCGSPATCSQLNCAGCCGPTGCLAGDTNAACGNNGFTCQTCSSTQSCSFSAGICE